MASVDTVYNASLPKPDEAKIKELRTHIAKLHELMPPAAAQRRLDAIAGAYKTFSGEALREGVYRPLKLKLEEFCANDEVQLRGVLVALDREFGDLQTIHATRLGNVIEAYSQYASKRYEIEMDVFWPHLRSVLPEVFLNLMGDQKILLDFSLAMATLGAGFACFSIAVGPWLWYQPVAWVTLACFGAATAGLFYRLGVTAAGAYGGFLRASFDLYRLDLMKALQRPRPVSLMVERKQWRQLSKLAVYSDPADFTLREEEAK